MGPRKIIGATTVWARQGSTDKHAHRKETFWIRCHSATPVQTCGKDQGQSMRMGLAPLGLSDSLESIGIAIRSANPEDCRAATWSWRSILEGLADRFWQDPGPTYPAMHGRDGAPLDVSHGKSLDRLRADLHGKDVRGNSGEAITSQLNLLMSSVRGLSRHENKAHSGDPVSEHVASLAVVTAYSDELIINQELYQQYLAKLLSQHELLETWDCAGNAARNFGLSSA